MVVGLCDSCIERATMHREQVTDSDVDSDELECEQIEADLNFNPPAKKAKVILASYNSCVHDMP